MIFWKVGYPIFFQEICSSGGKQTTHKFSEAFIVKNCHVQSAIVLASVVPDATPLGLLNCTKAGLKRVNEQISSDAVSVL